MRCGWSCSATRGGCFAAHQQAVRLYRQLSGEEPYLARAEVWQIIEQLGMLDERVRRLDGDRPGRRVAPTVRNWRLLRRR
jgi:hypothetical protein